MDHGRFFLVAWHGPSRSVRRGIQFNGSSSAFAQFHNSAQPLCVARPAYVNGPIRACVFNARAWRRSASTDCYGMHAHERRLSTRANAPSCRQAERVLCLLRRLRFVGGDRVDSGACGGVAVAGGGSGRARAPGPPAAFFAPLSLPFSAVRARARPVATVVSSDVGVRAHHRTPPPVGRSPLSPPRWPRPPARDYFSTASRMPRWCPHEHTPLPATV